jgi:FkbM family methyltransferase
MDKFSNGIGIKSLALDNESFSMKLLFVGDDPITSASKNGRSNFEPYSLNVWRTLASDFPISGSIWDVGSFIGVYSLSLLDLPIRNHVFAFEPSSGAFQRLLLHLRINSAWERVYPLQVALSDRNIKTDLHHRYGWYVLSSGESIDEPLEKYFSEEIECIQGDDLVFGQLLLKLRHSKGIPNPGFPGLIKIDVEGHELQTLMGLKRTISEYKPILLVEILSQKQFDEIVLFLDAYMCLQINEVQRNLSSTISFEYLENRNFLFVPKSMSVEFESFAHRNQVEIDLIG